MEQVVVPDDFPSILSGTGALKRLQRFAQVTVYKEKALSQDELIQRLQGAKVVINIRAYSKFDATALRGCPDLKMIAVLGVGTDNIDLAAASQLGIKVTNTPGYSAVAVAEHTLALMLGAARRVTEHENELRAGRWIRLPMTQLHGKTLGIIGFGDIGRQVASLARGIGMRVWAWTLHPSSHRAKESGVQFVELDQLLSQSDVISINIRASERTRGLISRQALEKIKPSCILVNTARASIVDTQAMIDALRTGRLAAAGLDVFDQEPLPANDPILSLPNAVLSPHNSGMTPEAMEKGNEMVVENVIAFLQGRLINLVND
ncbi:MAG TPA: phosphoglycerate dehydrogenase [Thermodesulfobacteriota bacterium]|nr:phosphoglycerate dehydrogenase [Thermodesulfobacteriota bacterium]